MAVCGHNASVQPDMPNPNRRSLSGKSLVELRVMTFNIKTGSLSSLQTIADIINRSGADLVGLQELDRCTRRSHGVDQPHVLGELTDMQAAFAPGLHDYDGGQYGIAALVSKKLHILDVVAHDLQQATAGEPRAALELHLAVNATATTPDFVFLNTHWDYAHTDNRRAQAQHVNRIARSASGLAPLLLVGDMNDVDGSAALEELRALWSPAEEGFFQIDWIFHRGDAWNATGVRELSTTDHPEIATASDHVPVVATYTLHLE